MHESSLVTNHPTVAVFVIASQLSLKFKKCCHRRIIRHHDYHTLGVVIISGVQIVRMKATEVEQLTDIRWCVSPSQFVMSVPPISTHLHPHPHPYPHPCLNQRQTYGIVLSLPDSRFCKALVLQRLHVQLLCSCQTWLDWSHVRRKASKQTNKRIRTRMHG